jgi:hypothetical protein
VGAGDVNQQFLGINSSIILCPFNASICAFIEGMVAQVPASVRLIEGRLPTLVHGG